SLCGRISESAHPRAGAAMTGSSRRALSRPRLITTDGDEQFWVSIDSALSTAETADYSALIYGMSNRTGHYIFKAERGRWDFETLLRQAAFYASDTAASA